MRRIVATRKRLERLEVRSRRTAATHQYRTAFYQMWSGDGEYHFTLVSDPGDPHCFFRLDPGPGPQLADFGTFDQVLCLTPAEMEM
jgi:hypothetical protein